MNLNGIVNNLLEAHIALPIRGASGNAPTCDFLIDTGFNGYLGLTRDIIAEIGATRLSTVPVVLADGAHVDLDSYAIELKWGNEWRHMEALAMDCGLLGMSLIQGMRLAVDVQVNGRVAIESLAK